MNSILNWDNTNTKGRNQDLTMKDNNEKKNLWEMETSFKTVENADEGKGK